jgi:hypothetical protein
MPEDPLFAVESVPKNPDALGRNAMTCAVTPPLATSCRNRSATKTP